MKMVKTAEETLREYNAHEYASDWRTIVAMKKFAQMHVEAALKYALENYEFKDGCDTHGVDLKEDSILNAYPLDLIK